MKRMAIASILLCFSEMLNAQNKDIENAIRVLEQTEVKAIVEKDSATLLKLWDRDFVVNNPDNLVVFPGTTTLDRPVLRNSRASFTRNVEHVVVKGNIAFSMGSENVTTMSKENGVGQAIRRRYTNVWMNTDGTWRLVARHANVICQNK